MTFYNRNGILYVSINGKRKSTKLPYSKNNIKKFKSYYEDIEFQNRFNISGVLENLCQSDKIISRIDKNERRIRNKYI